MKTTKTKSLQSITTSMFKRIDFKNVRFTKINTHRNKHIKLNYKSLSQLKI